MVALLNMPKGFQIKESERRVFPRKEVQCRVQGRRVDHSVAARRSPFLSLSTRDVSVGGLAAMSSAPLDPGERVSVFFPPEGINRGWDAYGRIIRCEPSAMGWRVAIEFDPSPRSVKTI